MSSVNVSKEGVPKSEPVDMKLEVVLLGVSDVDRTKAFYQNLGWRLDIDIANGDFRGVQMTPPNSQASIIFGKGIKSVGSTHTFVLAVDDVDVAASGDHDATSRTRVAVQAGYRRRNTRRVATRD